MRRALCDWAARRQDTPELIRVRLVYSMGYRYALHSNKLPGRPDLVLESRGKIIFVHGCFWHMHNCRHGRVAPATNVDYWTQKRERNATRDGENLRALRKEGWKVLVVWECWTRDTESLGRRLDRFLAKT